MREMKEYAKEINTCSKCGLCQAVCPVFKETLNDCAVSKGKFIMLEGVLKGDLQMSSKINKYLDMCSKCGKCKNFCPSGIDVCKIFYSAKAEYFKVSCFEKLFHIWQSSKIFNTALKTAELISNPFRTNYHNKSSEHAVKLLYFKGCANSVMPGSENAVKKVLKNYNVHLIEKAFDCCGLPFLSSGNSQRYEQAVSKNTKIINETHFDYILTDCASCAHTLAQYEIPERGFQPSIINICDYIASQPGEFVFKNPINVTFHKPCHLENDKFLKPILDKCINVNYIEMENYDDCCGFAGEFAIKNNKISRAIMQKKSQSVLKTNADYVLTTCPGCIIGLKTGLLTARGISSRKPEVTTLIEFLSQAEYVN